MNTILRQLQELADADLYALCEAVDMELQRREEVTDDEVPDSARRRAVEREQSYRRRNGSAAPPIRIVGFGKQSSDVPPDRAAERCRAGYDSNVPEFGRFPGVANLERPPRIMREKTMKDHEDPQSPDDPVILSLEAYRQANALPDDKPPEPTDDKDPKADEAFWAGRNLAMRRSARWAA